MLTALQIVAIINLLIAFGVDTSTIAIVQSELQPAPIVATSPISTTTPQVVSAPAQTPATIGASSPMPVAYDISLVPNKTSTPVGESVVVDVFFTVDGVVWNQYKKPPTFNGAPIEIVMSDENGELERGTIQAFDKSKGWFRGFSFSPKAGANVLTFTGAGQSHTVTITGAE